MPEGRGGGGSFSISSVGEVIFHFLSGGGADLFWNDPLHYISFLSALLQSLIFDCEVYTCTCSIQYIIYMYSITNCILNTSNITTLIIIYL